MHPYFHLFGRDFPAYGVMCALGIVTALLVSLYGARRTGIAPDAAFVLFTSALFGGFVGAALAFSLVTYGWVNPLSMFTGAREPGLVFYGGVLLGLGVFLPVSRRLRLCPTACLNAFAPAVPLGHALGRVGCYLAGCCYGIKTNLPFAVHYPPGHATGGEGVWPVQLIEAFFLMALGLFLLRDARSHPRRTAFVYLSLYAALRFFLEFLRGDGVRGSFLFLSTSQWISLGWLIGLLVWKNRRVTT